MNRELSIAASSLTTVLLLVSAYAQTGNTSEKPKLAEEQFKNIQVLKGVPADEFIPTMQFIGASLGVECDYCHVERAFDKDDKKPKQTARKMMQMMFAINKDNFDGQREVTCYSCHRGSIKPMAIPLVASAEAPAHPASETVETAGAPLPPADQLVKKYTQALGGADALTKISSRVQKGKVTGVGDQAVPIDIYTQAPGKRVSLMHTPGGDSVTAYNGTEGWTGTVGRPLREMHSADKDAASMDADLQFALHIPQRFTELKVLREETIENRSTYVVRGSREALPPVELYFDKENGLLLRMVRYTETALGRNPTQVDYADYREIGGVKAPFRWTIARPSGSFTIQVDETKQNVPIDENKFVKPPEPKPN